MSLSVDVVDKVNNSIRENGFATVLCCVLLAACGYYFWDDARDMRLRIERADAKQEVMMEAMRVRLDAQGEYIKTELKTALDQAAMAATESTEALREHTAVTQEHIKVLRELTEEVKRGR